MQYGIRKTKSPYIRGMCIGLGRKIYEVEERINMIDEVHHLAICDGFSKEDFDIRRLKSD